MKLCNMCGAPLDVIDENAGFTMEMNMGYGTEYDGDKLHMTLCCECMEKLIKSCKVSPIERRGED